MDHNDWKKSIIHSVTVPVKMMICFEEISRALTHHEILTIFNDSILNIHHMEPLVKQAEIHHQIVEYLDVFLRNLKWSKKDCKMLKSRMHDLVSIHDRYPATLKTLIKEGHVLRNNKIYISDDEIG